jgi:ABC-type phosphate transport system substrate-binding protein
VRRSFLIMALVVGLAGAAWAKDLAVVVNKSSPVKGLTLAELVKFCKGEAGKWPDGRPVTCVTRDPSSPEMKLTLQKVYGASAEAVKTLITTANHGRADHPAVVVVPTDEAVIRRVEATPGAVGIVDVYSITSAINVIKIGGKLPLEPGYPLHGN